MKKAKRLLAVLLTAVMLFGAACLPSYALVEWQTPILTGGQKYYFSYEQCASWILDMLDDMLADANIVMTCGDLDDLIGFALISNDVLGINLDKFLDRNGSHDENGDEAIDLRSVDALIKSLAGALDCLDNNSFVGFADALTVLGDLVDEKNGLLCAKGILSTGTLRKSGAKDDEAVLNMLIHFVCSLRPMLVSILSSNFNLGGLLKSLLGDMLSDLLPVPVKWVDNKINANALVRDLLYTLLIDTTATEAPAGETLDTWVQKIINWALVTGTDNTAEGGGMSLLGVNAEPLMPALADQPGGASIGSETITVDRDKDGVTETTTMSFYQLVNNAIQGLMGGMLYDMLDEMLIDLLEIEVTEEFPMGDPAVLQDEMFSLIIGAVEGLLVANGAPEINYTQDEMNYPVPKVKKLLNWLLKGDTANGAFPALDSFIKIDYYGLHIQDGFMSLLNDVARLLINLLPSLGLFESSAHLAYTPDQLNESWFLDENNNLVSSLDDAKVTQTYVTYETNEIIYPTQFVTDANGVQTPTAYCYLDDNSAVSLKDANGNGDVNADFIRPNYVITTKMVFANIIKLALNDFIDGCYWPEWTTDIPSVLAYGLAAFAAPVVPENNYYERLDAWHELEATGAAAVSNSIILADGEEIEALPYTTLKNIPIKDMGGNVTEYRSVVVPSAALNIICSFAAKRLNGVFHFDSDGEMFTTETTLEQFATEFLVWAVNQYMPAFIGVWNETTDRYEVKTYAEDYIQNSTFKRTGIFADVMTTTINAVYSDFTNREIKETANWDVVYDLIDNTLFKLLPTSWLPDLNGTAQFFNDWLFGNLINFDLQGILGLLTVNTDPNAELNKSVTQVLLNIIDRVLALVFNDNAVLNPVGRTNVVMANNTTSYTTFNEFLDCSSSAAGVPQLINTLLALLDVFKEPLLSTILPLIISSEYSRPYDKGYLAANGRTESSYKIEDLSNYLSDLYDNVNAYPVKTFTNEDDAESATTRKANAVRNADGVRTDVVLENGTLFGTYETLQEAKDVIEQLLDSYYVTECNDETLPEEERTYTYTLYFARDYLESANATLKTDENGYAYNEYSGFTYAQITSRTAENPYVSYDDDYKFFEFEDFGDAGYYYNNEGDAKDAAYSFIDEYNGFINDLGDAYGAWYMFGIESVLKMNSLLDTNGDGRYLTADVTEGDVTYYADGDPSIPEAMYPFSTSSAIQFKYYDVDTAKQMKDANAGIVNGLFNDKTGRPVTSENGSTLTPANYEQLALAIEAGNDPEQNVALSNEDAEKIVRLILGTLDFDITLNGEGQYNGSKQWNTLTDAQLSTIADWCTMNGFTYEGYTEENGNELTNGTTAYILKRPKFKLLTDGSLTFSNGSMTASMVPSTDVLSLNYLRIKETAKDEDRTFSEEVTLAISDGYTEYATRLYQYRQQLLNEIDECSWRIEQAEGGRSLSAESTMIKWVLDLTADDYMGAKGRNYTFEYDENGEQIYNADGTPSVVKMYTTSSYEKFRDAYDFAEDAYTASKSGNILASGITQSMLTAAYEGLLKAWQQLIKFEGFADWAQIDSFVAMAESILSDPYVNDPQFGVESGLDELRAALSDALIFTDFDGSIYDRVAGSKLAYDSEAQGEIDLAAANLNQAIQNLKYQSNPSLDQNPEVEQVVEILPTVYKDQVQYAHIFGLKEGIGFGDGTMEAIQVIETLGLKLAGMAVGGDNTISRQNSARGSGTNARIDGRFQNYLRFRYFAILYGDINGDTRIDGTDAAALRIYINNNEATSAIMGEAKFEAADVNHNGGVDVEDVELIMKHYQLHEDDETGVIYTIDQNVHGPIAQVVSE